MKNLLLVLLFAGCSAQAYNKQPDAGVPGAKSSVYVENRIKWNYNKYYPLCVKQCFKNTYSNECPDKCDADFKQIKTVLIRAIDEGKEDDFDDVMDSWYGRN